MRKYRFVLLPLAASLIIVLSTILFVLPKVREIFEIKGRLEEEQEKLSSLTEKVAFLVGLDEYELGEKVVVAEEALPSKKAIAEILVALSSLSSETEVSFGGLEISPGKLVPEKFEVLAFKLTLEGPRPNIQNFFGRVNQVLPIMKVISFGIQEEKATVEIESYSSSLPKSLGKIDTPLPEITKEEEKIYQKIAQFESFEKKLPSIPTGKENPFSEF